MTLTYIKLNQYDAGFPEKIIGWFNDGIKSFPLIFQEKGDVILQSNAPITLCDKIVIEKLGVKKLPADVIVECEK